MRSRLTPIVAVLFVQSAFAADLSDPAVRERWLQSMRNTAVPGAAVVAGRVGTTVLVQRLARRDVEHTKPVAPDTLFYIASCTKSFMSMAMVALSEDGKIDLDDPVKKYLPQFQIAGDKLTDSITIRDLMCHRWGLD